MGRAIDPIADRFFVLTVVATMLFTGRLGTGGYFVMIMRDRDRGRLPRVARGPVAAHGDVQGAALGEGRHGAAAITLAALLVAPAIAPWLIALVGVTSVLSIADYTLALWRARAR